jgi:hypothetical protein
LEAVRLAADQPGLVQPFTLYRALKEGATHRILRKDPAVSWPAVQDRDVWQVMQYSLGGCSVFTRDTWSAAGGYDDEFRGWGFEDVAFSISVERFTDRLLRRVESEMLHLWHPSAVDFHSESYVRNRARCAQYERWELPMPRSLQQLPEPT